MPRTMTSGERALLASDHANFHLRFMVEDSAGVMRDVSALEGMNFLVGATWGESQDANMATGTVTLLREADGVSLVPFVDTSPLNSPGPFLDVGRACQLLSAVTPPGTMPASGDWKECILGIVTDVDVTANPMTVTIADQGAAIIDAQIETPDVIYGDAGGASIESVMQSILDDNLGAGVVPLYTPAPSGFGVLPYKQSAGGIMDALHTLALQPGWDIRYRYDAADVSRLTFASPDRGKTTPDFVIGPSEYLNVTKLAISNADVRNVVRVYYQDKATGAVGYAEASDAGSIAEFGRRYMAIGEGSSNNIDTYEEALAMATAAVLDLRQPIADQVIEQFYFWPVQLGDLAGYLANGVHYTADQVFGVVSFQHTITQTTHRTSIAVRGQVAGAYRRWLLTRNGKYSGQVNTGPAPIIPPLEAEAQAFQDPAEDGSAWQQVIFEKAAASIEIFSHESVGPSVPVPELAQNRSSYSLVRQEGDLWNKDDQKFIVAIATRTGYWRKTICYGVGYDGTRGPTVVHEKQAVDVGAGPSAPPSAFVVTPSGTTNRVTFTIGDPDAYHLLFRNGYGIVLEPGIDAVNDTNVNADIDYHYQLCAWKNGQTSILLDAGVVPPASSNVLAPQWVANYPAPLSSNGAEYRWTSDPATTRVVIEVTAFTILGLWTPLAGAVFDAPSANVPDGTFIDTSYPPGTKLQARIRATVGGVDYFSTPAPVTYGNPTANIAPAWYNGTPWNFGATVNFQWRLAGSGATSLEILLLAEPAVGITPAKPGAVLYTTTVPATIAAGNVTLANPAIVGGVSTPLVNRRVQLFAFYGTAGVQSSPVAKINVAP